MSINGAFARLGFPLANLFLALKHFIFCIPTWFGSLATHVANGLTGHLLYENSIFVQIGSQQGKNQSIRQVAPQAVPLTLNWGLITADVPTDLHQRSFTTGLVIQKPAMASHPK
jgi:hypothetical protein